jgi:uncharacterized protein (DUF924 family)
VVSVTAQAVLDFWFLPTSDRSHNHFRDEWFRKEDAFDAAIRARFSADVEAALNGQLPLAGGAEERLAHILLLDQFTRNIFRDKPQAFAGDAVAHALADDLVVSTQDKNLSPFMRWFAYLPFEHSETLADQAHSVALFTCLLDDAPPGHERAFASALDYAKQHQEVIARFGRFPHRNAILGRESTESERLFLQQPGSSF